MFMRCWRGFWHARPILRRLPKPPDGPAMTPNSANPSPGWQKSAAAADPESVKDEYAALFIGVGRGELLPYGSYYLTGFLNEKPLARVRQSLREIGVERDPAVKDPEDHIAALLDVMVGLILGTFHGGSDLAAQKRFFDDHIAAWADYFFKDLEEAKTADLFKAVGSVGRAFLAIEKAAFEMA